MGKNRRPSLAVPIDRKGSGTPAPIAVPGKVYGKTTSASPVTPTFTSVKRRGSGGDTLVAQPSSPTLTLATLLEEPLSIGKLTRQWWTEC